MWDPSRRFEGPMEVGVDAPKGGPPVFSARAQMKFGALNEPRRSVIGLLLMTIGAEIGLFSFLHAALRRHG